ncbi:hypothetical protein MTO96_001302 [Rhipicephalus appendiculatus]
MSTEVLALRREVWDADGIHLIYNAPWLAAGENKKAPVRPFAGLCVAFLLYLDSDKTEFSPMLGELPKAYSVGWVKQDWGAYSLTALNLQGGPNGWTGFSNKGHPGFNAGYYYVYFYFKNRNTLNVVDNVVGLYGRGYSYELRPVVAALSQGQVEKMVQASES